MHLKASSAIISIMGIKEVIIMVPTIVLPIILNQVPLKSRRDPPTRPYVTGLIVIFAVTTNSRMDVLMN